jgi:hypothetical protein
MDQRIRCLPWTDLNVWAGQYVFACSCVDVCVRECVCVNVCAHAGEREMEEDKAKK